MGEIRTENPQIVLILHPCLEKGKVNMMNLIIEK